MCCSLPPNTFRHTVSLALVEGVILTHNLGLWVPGQLLHSDATQRNMHMKVKLQPIFIIFTQKLIVVTKVNHKGKFCISLKGQQQNYKNV